MSEAPASSLVAAFDELVGGLYTGILNTGLCEEEFLWFARNQEECRVKWLTAEVECKRVSAALEESMHRNSLLERQVSLLQDINNKHCKKLLRTEQDKDYAESQLLRVLELLREQQIPLGDKLREELLAFGNILSSDPCVDHAPLDNISEGRSSLGSVFSNYTHSEDELDLLMLGSNRTWKNHQPLEVSSKDVPATKRSRPSEGSKPPQCTVTSGTSNTLVATTTLQVPMDGSPITAQSCIQRLPEQPTTPTGRYCVGGGGTFTLGLGRPNLRPHSFVKKTILRGSSCDICNKRLKFGKFAMRCTQCRAVYHIQCYHLAPLPCVHVGNTPTVHGTVGYISDYTPPTPPLVPCLLVHCVNEVDTRGLGEVGLYRVSGMDKDVKALKDKFLRGKGIPNLSQVDIHVVCGTIKDFLRQLAEPLVTMSLRQSFMSAVDLRDQDDVRPALYQAIGELPAPNRDTLAFLLLHLQRVADCPENRMSLANLAKVFGPTLVGFSNEDLEAAEVLDETLKQVKIVMNLLLIPADYWQNFVVMPFSPLHTLPLAPRSPQISPINLPNYRIARRQHFFDLPDY